MKHIIWLDTETTGLEAHKGKLLEVASLVTDIHLNEVAEFHRVASFSEETLKLCCDDVVTEMHKKSGLWDECCRSTTLVQTIEYEFAHFLQTNAPGVQYDRVLAGNTVRFDREFLAAHTPNVLKHVHYRMIDVSSLSFAMIPVVGAEFKFDKLKHHRAMSDVRESLAQFKAVWKQFFQWCERGGVPLLNFGFVAEKGE